MKIEYTFLPKGKKIHEYNCYYLILCGNESIAHPERYVNMGFMVSASYITKDDFKVITPTV